MKFCAFSFGIKFSLRYCVKNDKMTVRTFDLQGYAFDDLIKKQMWHMSFSPPYEKDV